MEFFAKKNKRYVTIIRYLRVYVLWYLIMLVSILSAVKGHKSLTVLGTVLILAFPFLIVFKNEQHTHYVDATALLDKSASMLKEIQVRKN